MTDRLKGIKDLAAEAVAEGQRMHVKRCWPWTHVWGRWQDCTLQDRSYGMLMYEYIGQQHTCIRCGITKIRKI